jgi:hypothetical protein
LAAAVNSYKYFKFGCGNLYLVSHPGNPEQILGVETGIGEGDFAGSYYPRLANCDPEDINVC